MVVKSCYLARIIDSEEQLKEFTEELNCTIKHRLVIDGMAKAFTIEDATGNKSVLILPAEQAAAQTKGKYALRIVVDNIKEGIEFFKSKGYKAVMETVETESNFACALAKGNEVRLIFEHKKNPK